MSKTPKPRIPREIPFFNESFLYPGLQYSTGLQSAAGDALFGRSWNVRDKDGNIIEQGRSPGMIGQFSDFVQSSNFGSGGQGQRFLNYQYNDQVFKKDNYGRMQGYDKGLFNQAFTPKFGQTEQVNYGGILNNAFDPTQPKGVDFSKYRLSTSAPGAGRSYSIGADKATARQFEISDTTKDLLGLARSAFGGSGGFDVGLQGSNVQDAQGFNIGAQNTRRDYADTYNDDFAFMMNRANAAANARVAAGTAQLNATGKTGGQALAAIGQLQAQAAGETAQAAFGATTAARSAALQKLQLEENKNQFDKSLRQSYDFLNAGIKKDYDLANLNKNVAQSQFNASLKQQNALALKDMALGFGQLDLGGFNTRSQVEMRNAELGTQARMRGAELTEQARQSDAQFALGAGQINAQIGALESQNFGKMLDFVTQNRAIDSSENINRFNAESNYKLGLGGLDLQYNQLFAPLTENARQFNLSNMLKSDALKIEGFNAAGNLVNQGLVSNAQAMMPALTAMPNFYNFYGNFMNSRYQAEAANKAGQGSLAGMALGAGVGLLGGGMAPGIGLGLMNGFGGGGFNINSPIGGGIMIGQSMRGLF
jgi:hypothetical protein